MAGRKSAATKDGKKLFQFYVNPERNRDAYQWLMAQEENRTQSILSLINMFLSANEDRKDRDLYTDLLNCTNIRFEQPSVHKTELMDKKSENKAEPEIEHPVDMVNEVQSQQKIEPVQSTSTAVQRPSSVFNSKKTKKQSMADKLKQRR